LAGEPLLVHASRAIIAADCIGCLVVAAPPGREEETRQLLASALPDYPADRVRVVTGGAQRQESVAAALRAVPAGLDIVLVHDAARALVPTALIQEVAVAVHSGHEAVIPVLPVVDTITQVGPNGEVVGQPDRSTLRAVQTPQGFRRTVLEAAHAAATDTFATDDASLVSRLGVPVHTIPGSPRALKITTPHDLIVAEALLRSEALAT
jgi:2-C-methyl-D-erythritol 4-phosphate cytidylyltransferase